MFSLVLAILCSAALSLIMKAVSSEHRNRYGVLLGNYLTCVCLALLTMHDRSVLLHLSPVTISLGLAGGVLFLAGLVMMQSSVAVNGATFTAAFSKLGMILSITISILFFHELPGLFQLLGIVLVLPSIFLINHIDPSAERAPLQINLLLLTLVSNGLADSMAKFFSWFGDPLQETAYLCILFLTAAVLTAILAFRETTKTGRSVSITDFTAGLAVGIPNYFSSLFLLHALQELPAVFVYPCFSGGTILVVMTASYFLFHERMDRMQKAGLSLILAALILLNL